jgi:hypothetical protein
LFCGALESDGTPHRCSFLLVLIMAEKSVKLLRVSRIPILVMLVVALAAGVPAEQPKQTELPPVSFTCPMHPDIIEDKPGTCPVCRMALVPVRLDTAFSCPVHTSVIETEQGTCRICRRRLVQITISLFWTCAGHPDVREVNPGTCPDGQIRVSARERRAHGDHNPRHGGQFFMAPDNWHHLEGTYPRSGVFRVFLYDDFTRPLSLRGITGRAVTSEVADPATQKYKDVATVPLAPAKNGRYLEARVPAGLPAHITAKMKFDADGPEHRFDFSFPAYTKEPVPGAPPVVTTPLAAAVQTGAAPAEGAPETADALLAGIKASSAQADSLLKQGAFAQLYIPALATKDGALALEAHASELPEGRRSAAATAVRRIVLAAWLIDLYGDLGDRPKLDGAFRSFDSAVADLSAAYGR